MYLGNGLVITAAHVPGNFADTKPRVVMGGVDMPSGPCQAGIVGGRRPDAAVRRRGRASRPDAHATPAALRHCRPIPGESVVVVTPETAARSHVLPPTAVPRDLRARFDTVIGDVATTGNSGSGVLDARKSCLLGIISRKISRRADERRSRRARADPGHREVLRPGQKYPRLHSAAGVVLATAAAAAAKARPVKFR